MTIRIAVAGAGLIGKDHLARIDADADFTLASIVDPAAAARELADRYGVPLYPDLDALFAAGLPDALIIATPNQLHEVQATQAIEAGLPILLEKPATDTIEAGERLQARADELGARILVGHHRTHGAIMRMARDVVTSGRLGDLVAISGTALYYKPDDYFPAAPWRTQPGGGPVRINIIHEVHNFRLLCGDIARVEAVTSNRTRGFAVEDTAAIIFTFASGVLGTFVISDAAGSPRSWEQTAGEMPAFDPHPDQDCYHLAGTFGSLSVPTMQLFSYAQPDDRSWWKPFSAVERLEVPLVDPLVEQLRHFGAVVRGEAEPLVTLRDGLQNVKVVEAILESAERGRPVEIS